jgi:hypothetical protein
MVDEQSRGDPGPVYALFRHKGRLASAGRLPMLKKALFGVALVAACNSPSGPTSYSYINLPPSDCADILRTTGDQYVRDTPVGWGNDFRLGIPEQWFFRAGKRPTEESGLPDGFSYYDGHRGGYGETLQTIGCGSSVFLLFAYGTFSIVATRRFGSVTERGLRIGDSLERFLALYPDTDLDVFPLPSYLNQQDSIYMVGPFSVFIDGGRVRYMGVGGVYPSEGARSVGSVGPTWGPDPWR